MPESSNAYDDEFIARLYAYAPHERDQSDIEFYVDLADQADHTIEVGCGSGRITIEMLKRQINVTGVEPSDVMRSVLMKRVMALPMLNHFYYVWNGSAQQIPVEAGVADLIVAPYRVLNHARRVMDQYDKLRS